MLETSKDPLVWTGAALLFSPMLLFLVPNINNQLAKLYYAQDDLELTRFRRQWIPILLSILIAVPDILLLKSRHENDGVLAWKVFSIYFYIALPIVVCMLRPPAKLPLDTGDLVLVLLLVVPLILNYYTFALPDVTLRIKEGWPDISMLHITAVNTGLFVFNGLRPLQDFGYTILLGWKDWIRVLTGLVLAAATLLPLAYASGILNKSQSHPSFEWALAHCCTILVLVSLPQELLFRGVIQNLLHSRLESSYEISKYTRDDNGEALNLDDYPRYNAVSTSDDGGFEGDAEAQLETERVDTHAMSFEEVHSHFYSRGVCCWLLLPTVRDWAALTITSLLYAVVVMDHRKWGQENGAVFGMAIILGLISGYVWRQTSKVTASALVHAVVLYVGVHVLRADIGTTAH